MESKTIRLLTIGNSFADNATRYLGQIAAAAECKLIYTGANLPGGPLSIHWEGICDHENNYKEGCLYDEKSLRELLISERWDIVTLQQFSWISHDINTYRPYAANLQNFVRQHAPSAKIMLHQTWAYRADDTERITPDYSQETMHADIRSAYHTIAEELNVSIIPVGDAFANARNHPDWNFVPDPDFYPETATHPNYPNDRHSLNVGFTWNEWSDMPEIMFDTHHASHAGQYLGAAVFFETLFEKSVLDNTFLPEELPVAEVRFLQKIAHETVSSM
ncbi:DUF4886 domain-containing protein [PVC group bacterium]|nr:DUF4886 domain-containing protein [PVC group bacterium]